MKNLIKSTTFILLSIVALTLPISAHAAFFSLSSSESNPTVGQQFEIEVKLNTQDSDTNGADLVASFPHDLFQVNSATFRSIYSETFDQINNSTGSLALTSAVSSIDQGFKGDAVWAKLFVTALAQGSGEFSINCDPSSVWLKGGNGQDILDCTLNKSLSLSIKPGQSPASTPAGGASPAPAIIKYQGECSADTPPIPSNVNAKSGPGNGQVTLSWYPSSPVTHYGINYGTQPKNYTQGAPNVGNVSSFIISDLLPGTRYYFTVYAVNECAPSAISYEANAKASTTMIVPVNPHPEIVFMPINEASQSAISQEVEPTLPPQNPETPQSSETLDSPFYRKPLFFFLLAAGALFLTVLFLLGKKKEQQDLILHPQSARNVSQSDADRHPSHPQPPQSPKAPQPPFGPHHGSPKIPR